MICTRRKPYSWNFLSFILLSQQALCDCNWSFKNHRSCWKPARALKTARCYWSGIKCRTSPGSQIPGQQNTCRLLQPTSSPIFNCPQPRAPRDGERTSPNRSNNSNKTKTGSCLLHEAGSLLAKCKHKPWAFHMLGKKRKQSKKAIYRLQMPPDALQDVLSW